jgi:thiol-disulfide isomerase/thioredoxin
MKSLACCISVAALITGLIAAASRTEDEGRMPDLDGATDWLNSAPLSKKSVRGKVVLVNFWTYSCINSLRELPYVKAWAAKYKDAGLVVIGVHSPEFGFEKVPANVKSAVSELKIDFAVPIDSSHSIWTAFRNQYWPADYFIDRTGRIRYHHFGEGEYEKSERVIRELLAEGGSAGLDGGTVQIKAARAEAPPSNDVQSTETYVGYARAERFASREKLGSDLQRTYSTPAKLALNEWGLSGVWKVDAESASLQTANGKILFRFHSRDLHLVVGPQKNGTPVRFKVTIDGAPPREDCGADSTPDGLGLIREPRLYQLIRQKHRVEDRTFEIEFLDPGAQAFSFTFG